MGQKKLSRKRNVILVLSRYPEPGQTKTRLIPFLKPRDVGHLALSFIQDTDGLLGNLRGVDKIWCYSPPTEKVRNFFQRTLKFCDGLYPQMGDCFPDRLRNSMKLGFDLGYQQVVHMGTDSPDLPHLWLKEIFVKLQRRDLVIGPALDGGYYLLGMKNADIRMNHHGERVDPAPAARNDACHPEAKPKDLDLFHDLEVGSHR